MNVIKPIKQGIEALEEACGDRCNAEYNPCYAKTAITDLHQALSELEREALKLALEAFEEIAWSNSTDWQRDRAKVAITAIKEALAQPEQEPVAYLYTSRITGAQGFSHHPMPRFMDSDSWDIKPLYTTPPQPEQEPLTPHEIGKFVGTHEFGPEQLKWFRLGEAAHGIKEN